MKTQEKIYKEAVYMAVIDHLLPKISYRDIFNFDKTSWACAVIYSQQEDSNISDSLVTHAINSTNSIEIPMRFTTFCEKLKEVLQGDEYVSNILVAKIYYELEIEKALPRMKGSSGFLNNPFVDFKLMEDGPGREELTNFDFEMFFDIVKCSTDLQNIIRLLYSPHCDEMIWDNIDGSKKIELDPK